MDIPTGLLTLNSLNGHGYLDRPTMNVTTLNPDYPSHLISDHVFLSFQLFQPQFRINLRYEEYSLLAMSPSNLSSINSIFMAQGTVWEQ